MGRSRKTAAQPQPQLAVRQQQHIDRPYLLFIVSECDGFEAALLRAYAMVEIRMRYGQVSAQTQAFNDFQAAITIAAIIGKILWPSASARVPHLAIARGARLRKLIGIQTDPLLQDWNIRNHFEHIDERLDEWTTTPNKNIILYHLGEAIQGVGPRETFNRYDRSTNTFHMLQHSVNMDDLRRSVLAVAAATSKAIEAISPGLWTRRLP